MSLTVMPRRVAPLNGSWFNTGICLVQLIDLLDSGPGVVIDSNAQMSRVPIWVNLEPTEDSALHKAGIRIGSIDAPAFYGFGAYQVGLFTDLSFNPELNWKNPQWLYQPWDDDADENEDATAFYCDKCRQTLYIDLDGRRESRSAVPDKDGNIICRNCDAVGPVFDKRAEERIALCRRLADRIGPKCREKLDRDMDLMLGGKWFGQECQCRIYCDGDYSLGFHISRKGKTCIVGGLILHQHPCEIRQTEDGFDFERHYHNGQVYSMRATEEEIGNIHWSIHT